MFSKGAVAADRSIDALDLSPGMAAAKNRRKRRRVQFCVGLREDGEEEGDEEGPLQLPPKLTEVQELQAKIKMLEEENESLKSNQEEAASAGALEVQGSNSRGKIPA